MRNVTAPILALRGDTLPVSALPVDGTYPTGTTKYEKRNIADEVPIWESDLCIQCGQCAIVCPHSVIRATLRRDRLAERAAGAFKAAPINARGYPESRFTLQIYVEDCTGCGVRGNCPAHSPSDPRHQGDQHERSARAPRGRAREHPLLRNAALGRSHAREFRQRARRPVPRAAVRILGACAGCGETPYLKLMSQLFGDRLQIANATGCSSIYGANLPTTPWAANADGRGPAWNSSLFEDNAEFGLGYRLD